MIWLKAFAEWPLPTIFVFGVGLAGGYWMLKYDNGSSIQKKIDQAATEKETLQAEVDELTSKLRNLQEADRTINEMGDQFDQFLKLIPNKMNSSLVMEYLNTISLATGVRVTSIQSHPTSERKDFYEKLKISVTLRGFYTEILSFLAKLTGLSEIVTVENFEMDHRGVASSGEASTGEVQMKMDIYGYRYLPPEEEEDSKS